MTEIIVTDLSGLPISSGGKSPSQNPLEVANIGFTETPAVKDIRIVLADDNSKVRSALRLILEQDVHIQVVAEVENSCDLISIAKLTSPDLVLLDWELPGDMRIETVVTELHRNRPAPRVIALSGLPQVRNLAMALGADDFVCKVDPPELLIGCLQTECNDLPK